MLLGAEGFPALYYFILNMKHFSTQENPFQACLGGG
jgi:hypothetical protein